MFASNDVAEENRRLMSVTRDTSHSPIAPCGPWSASPVGESSRYSSTALFSSALDRGENTRFEVVIVQTVDDIDPDVPANMIVFFAFECTHAPPQSFRLKNVAPQNMPYMSFTLDTSHFARSPLNDVAPRNMPLISSTLDTSHLDTSPSKNFAWANTRLMSVTRDTSHSPIDPCGPLEHSPFGDSLMHASTALLSCTLDCGENTDVGAGLRDYK